MNTIFWRIIGFLLILSILLCYTNGSTRRRQASQGYRLPDNVIPRKYNLEIITNLNENNFSFQGKVLIKMQCVKPTNKIILHSKDLEILENQVNLKQITAVNETVDVPITSHSYAKENDFYIVTLEQRLVAGSTYLFYIPFKGVLNEGLAGYYRSSYFDKQANKIKWLSVTQFESTDARRAFPCFDEPAMKATFVISLGHEKHLRAISNMPLKDSRKIENKKDWILDRFEETVPMSTYLVAFMISEFEYKEAEKKNSNVTFRIWARKEAIDQVNLAKEIGPKILSYFAKYFDVDYPLPKQDMAAIPDFNAGAMENWGLITFRETALLYDPNSSSISSQYYVASVVSHELAHQWFGNLVTMKWWTDLWLNEGFASYVGELGVHHLFPEWKSSDSTSVNDFTTVLSLDALKSSHPVSIPIGHPSEIEQIFDTISYKKGSYLIRMMNKFLGEDIFQKSVSNYLKKHRYSNAAQDDLWNALTQTAQAAGILQPNVTVKIIMDTWTLQTGYPLVTVTRDYEKKTVTVTQERYFSVPSFDDKNNAAKHSCWWVPLSYTTSKELMFNDTKPKKWLTCSGPLSFTTDLKDDEWFIFNLMSSGLYRVNYDENNWKLLERTLSDGNEYAQIEKLNRVQIIIDTFGLAWIGKIKYRTALDIVQYLRHETEYLPWKAGLNSLNQIDKILMRTATYGDFKKFSRHLLEPVYNKFISSNDFDNDFEGTKFRIMIISLSCYYGVGECEEQMQNMFKNWYSQTNPDENNPIPKDLRNIVYCQALKTGGEKYWEFLWQRYQKSNLASEKQLILISLGCVKELWLLQRYLQWSLEPSRIRKQDSITVFTSVAENEIGYAIAKEFLQKRFMEIHDYHGLKSSRLGRYLKIIADQIITRDGLDEFQDFTSSRSIFLKQSEISVKQAIETINSNIAWHEMHFKDISDYFLKF